MGKLTINLCEELHQKIREDVAADESLTTSLLMERIIREHYEGPKPRPRIESGGRTMAFSVSEELFQRVKRYLAAHGVPAGFRDWPGDTGTRSVGTG